VKWIALVLRHVSESKVGGGVVRCTSAQSQWMPDDSVDALFTDPPYYDSYPYADLSDFFFPLLAAGFERVAGSAAEGFVLGNLTPKDEELVVQPTRKSALGAKDGRFYESGLRTAFEKARGTFRAPDIAYAVLSGSATDSTIRSAVPGNVASSSFSWRQSASTARVRCGDDCGVNVTRSSPARTSSLPPDWKAA